MEVGEGSSKNKTSWTSHVWEYRQYIQAYKKYTQIQMHALNTPSGMMMASIELQWKTIIRIIFSLSHFFVFVFVSVCASNGHTENI